MARSTSFYYAFLVLPAPKRRAIIAVFDFCRAVDDGVDLAAEPARADQAVDTWRKEVALVFTQGTPATSEGRALQATLSDFRLPRQAFDDLVDGVAMDVRPARFDTFADLEPYCHRVASAVGLMCIEIFGYRDPAVRDYARDLGVALQLTNILRDVAVDFRRGRVYLPMEDFERFGCSIGDLERAVHQPGVSLVIGPLQAVLEHQAARARVFFSRATRTLPKAEARNVLAAEIMRSIYWDLLRRIEAVGCDVFGQLIRVPRPAQARIAVQTWWKTPRVGPQP